MKLHSREMPTKVVESKFGVLVADFFYEGPGKDVTRGEMLRIVSSVFHSTLASMAKYMIREERHGDPNKEGGLE